MSEMDVVDSGASFESEEYSQEHQKMMTKKKKKKKKQKEMNNSECSLLEICSSSLVFLESPNNDLPGSAETQEEEQGRHLKKKQKKTYLTEVTEEALAMPDGEPLMAEKGVRKQKKKRHRENSIREKGVHTEEEGVKKKKRLREKEANNADEGFAVGSFEDPEETGVQKGKTAQGELNTGSKVISSCTEVCKVEAGNWTKEIQPENHETNSMKKAVEAGMESAIEELKEFIPEVDKKAFSVVSHMIKYDLPRFKAFKQEGLSLRRGRFTAEENERLVQNVSDFLALTGIDNATKLFFPQRYPEEKQHITKMKAQYGFHSELAAGIPRPWHDVYSRGRKLFNNFQHQGRYTEDDLKSLLKFHTLYGPNWMKISEITGRSNLSLEKRFSHLAYSKGKWSEEEEKKLVRIIRKHLLKQVEPGSAEDGQGATIRKEKLYSKLPWIEVAQEMETRSWSQCRVKWMGILKKKMTSGQKVYEGRKSLKAKIKLIEALYSMNVEDVADVDWEKLTGAIGNVPPAYVQARFYKLKVTTVPKWQNMDFADIIDFLYKSIKPKLEEELRCCKTEDEEESMDLKEVFNFSDIFDVDDEQTETNTQQLD
uniref:Transcription termination factor 1, tandem duplicate 6 n=1 Tax=Scleropages formosus TaxID=113540 RepID=A0A8C9RWV9_SCLFO